MVYNRYCGRMKELKDYIEIINKKYNLEVEYSNGTKNISEINLNLLLDKLNLFLNKSSLSDSIFSLKNFFLNQHSYIVEFISAIKEEILDPLKETYQNLKNKGNKLNDETRKSEKFLTETMEKLEKVF